MATAPERKIITSCSDKTSLSGAMVFCTSNIKSTNETRAVIILNFLVLIQKTISPASDTLSLHDLLIFLGGAVVLVGFNIYLIFVRQ